MDLKNMLDALYRKLDEGFLSATYVHDSGCTTRYFDRVHISEMAEYIIDCGKRHNTYIGINPRSEMLPGYKRGGREDIAAVVCAYQDYDIRGEAHSETALPGSEAELKAFIDELPVRPGILVSTGNGMHAYWIFEDSFIIRRVSTDYEEQQTSYAAQIDYYTTYIRSNPEWEFAGVYTDEGISLYPQRTEKDSILW